MSHVDNWPLKNVISILIQLTFTVDFIIGHTGQSIFLLTNLQWENYTFHGDGQKGKHTFCIQIILIQVNTQSLLGENSIFANIFKLHSNFKSVLTKINLHNMLTTVRSRSFMTAFFTHPPKKKKQFVITANHLKTKHCMLISFKTLSSESILSIVNLLHVQT